MRTLPPLLLALVMAGSAAAQDPADALARAEALLARAPVIDGHNDLPWEIRTNREHPGDVEAYDLRSRTPGHTDIARLRAGHVGAQFWSIYIPGEIADSGYARVQLEEFDIARRVIARYPEALMAAGSVADIERAMREGKVASLLGMEGGHAIENSLGALRAYYALGARYMTLTHNVTLDWADAALDEARHGGLTAFGREVVAEMNRLGMLVDLSHVSPATMSDALDATAAPVIFSHSSARALTEHPRNVPDSILRRLPQNGGVVMVTFVPEFISKATLDGENARRAAMGARMQGVTDPARRREIAQQVRAEFPVPKATVQQVADHIEHVVKVAGIDHVGIGSDFDGIGDTPTGLDDVSTFPNLFAELVRRGWSDEDMAKLSQGNVLRALRQAEAVAKRLQAERPPSTATIDQLDRKPAT